MMKAVFILTVHVVAANYQTSRQPFLSRREAGQSSGSPSTDLEAALAGGAGDDIPDLMSLVLVQWNAALLMSSRPQAAAALPNARGEGANSSSEREIQEAQLLSTPSSGEVVSNVTVHQAALSAAPAHGDGANTSGELGIQEALRNSTAALPEVASNATMFQDSPILQQFPVPADWHLPVAAGNHTTISTFVSGSVAAAEVATNSRHQSKEPTAFESAAMLNWSIDSLGTASAVAPESDILAAATAASRAAPEPMILLGVRTGTGSGVGHQSLALVATPLSVALRGFGTCFKPVAWLVTEVLATTIAQFGKEFVVTSLVVVLCLALMITIFSRRGPDDRGPLADGTCATRGQMASLALRMSSTRELERTTCGFEFVFSRPIAAGHPVRLVAWIQGPSRGISLTSQLSQQACVISSASVSRPERGGVVAAGCEFMNFTVALADAPDVFIQVKGEDVSIDQFNSGRSIARIKLSQAPDHWRQFALRGIARAASGESSPQTCRSGDGPLPAVQESLDSIVEILKEDPVLEFEEFVLPIGVEVTLFGELYRRADGTICLQPWQEDAVNSARFGKDKDLVSWEQGCFTDPGGARKVLVGNGPQANATGECSPQLRHQISGHSADEFRSSSERQAGEDDAVSLAQFIGNAAAAPCSSRLWLGPLLSFLTAVQGRRLPGGH